MPKGGVSRVESMFSKLSVVGLGSLGERVIGPVHQGVLAKHGSHGCGLCCEYYGRTRRMVIFDGQGGTRSILVVDDVEVDAALSLTIELRLRRTRQACSLARLTCRAGVAPMTKLELDRGSPPKFT